MSSASMAILTIGVVPVAEMLPLLTEHIREDQITHISLLGKMAREEVMQEYAVESGEETLLTLLSDNQIAQVSRQKVERDLRSAIAMLDKQNYDLILLMSTHPFRGFAANNAILLEPQRIIPPLVASIVDGHQVGVIVPVEEILPLQQEKWQVLENTPLYAISNPVSGSKDDLLAAARELIAQGADVLMLDCLCYHQQHRDVLQKALDIPVLLSNVLVSRLAAELLV
ncbi:AroM family protein [Klebsiella sp. RHBSTW-00484]|uniref:AroM family protein n=1 Tax=unclassified Klebsiella TaxID=2608929 RepID=UPI0015E56366|nr:MULTISPECIES: AroM family protein [unclassified Klebsiella]MBA7845650.1 AroM family protein [Klebsiella sp. RHBSTW-00465]QLO38407.1 AroM family protein [Klebsiella sp. RHBSTW-00484]QLT77927.1 AroM family protein [Klebsiella sp. RHBSTW-00464]